MEIAMASHEMQEELLTSLCDFFYGLTLLAKAFLRFSSLDNIRIFSYCAATDATLCLSFNL